MTRGILIAGNESLLTGAIETEAVRRVENYGFAFIPDRFSADAVKPSSSALSEHLHAAGRIPLDWNPGSAISARTLVLAAENRLGRIDDAILVCDPPPAGLAVNALSIADVEVLVNDHIKGWFFLVKELSAVFKKQGKGSLALVYPEYGSTGSKDSADMPGLISLAVFRSLTGGLLSTAAGEPYYTNGFTCSEAGDENGFAVFIFKQLDEENRRTNGKLFKYGKLGLFR